MKIFLIGILFISSFFISQSNIQKEIRYIFQVNKTEYTIIIENKERKSNTCIPIFIKDNRAMIDTRFFQQEKDFLITWFIKEPTGRNPKKQIEGRVLIGFDTKRYQTKITFESIFKFLIDENKIFHEPFISIYENDAEQKYKWSVFPEYKGNRGPSVQDATDISTIYSYPLRFFFEKMGFIVDWNEENKTITVHRYLDLKETSNFFHANKVWK